MAHNFDEIINRSNTKSVKYDFPDRFGKMGYNYIPLWIADMDFRAPLCVREALIERANHGVFGYSDADDDYFDAVKDWMKVRHEWNIEPHWIVKTAGVLNAVSAVIRAVTNQNDAVLIQSPSYNMFNTVIETTKRKVVRNNLVLEDGRYHIDFSDFEKQIVRNGVKLFILCNPYNPVGRVWTAEELIQMGDICLKHGVIVIADEVYQDFVYAPHRHLVFVKLKPEYEDITVTCTAPTKTFNLSGLAVSNIFIINNDLRDDIANEIFSQGRMGAGIMELLACQAAYSGGAEWLDTLMQYLRSNVDFIRDFILDKLPEVTLIEPEGTYLLWLDFRAVGFWGKELEAYLADEAKVLVNGAPGAEGFLRVNLACPRSTLEQAFTQLERAIRKAR